MRTRSPLWRSTPPAIFPVSLGFMGLGLAWRNASAVISVPEEIGDLLLGLSTAFFLYFLVLYLVKLAARPRVLFEDMVSGPARAGVAALAMSMMLLAAALLPFNISVPEVWWTGVILQIVASAIVLHAIWKEPPEHRHFTPFQYLTFVGPVVGPIAGIPLGYVTESFLLATAALIPFVFITIGYGLKLWRVRPPLALRPSVAITLAPISLFALCYGQLGIDWAFYIFFIAGWIVALALLSVSLWLTKGGWTPFWGSFTFPIATFTNVQVLASSKGVGDLATFGIYLGLTIGTPLILFIVYKAVLAWVTGEMAKKSGAAMA
jgi:tellurite resistance protein